MHWTSTRSFESLKGVDELVRARPDLATRLFFWLPGIITEMEERRVRLCVVVVTEDRALLDSMLPDWSRGPAS